MAVIATKPYVEFKEEGYWVIGTRISLDSIVYAFRNGLLPESIAQAYPLLDLEKVYTEQSPFTWPTALTLTLI
jgi:hypothetical protein